MASTPNTPQSETKNACVVHDSEQQSNENIIGKKQDFDYSKRASWLRAAVLGANDGLISTASLMMGVGAVKHDIKAMILTGFAGLIAGACAMAIGEFVSVYSQLDIEVAQLKRDNIKVNDDDKEGLPNPLQAATASAFSFSIGAMVPLLAASFIRDYKVRIGVVSVAVTVALVAFGWLGAVLGKAPVLRSSLRVLLGGWAAMEVKMSTEGSKGPKNPQESKDDTCSSHEVTICLQCGDKGTTNAFVYCVYCLKYAVHRYCLDTLPETLDEFVIWVCDDCDEVPVTVTSSKYAKTETKDRCRRRTSSKYVENNSKKKRVQGKTNNMVIEPTNGNAHTGTIKDMEVDNRVDSDSIAKLDHLTVCGQPEFNSPPESGEVAQPVIDPIWSGSFNIPNSKEYDEEIDRLIVAHLSKKVGKQVYDEAKLFPSMLQLELHPKAHVWPKRFQELRPSDDDIAIYFFPLSRRYEGVFDELVEEMMDQELALKAITKNAELLVFPSNELPLNFWRFQGKYFLWGVFRGKQAHSSEHDVDGPLTSS